jgi:Protein of unknown function (DUF4242)
MPRYIIERRFSVTEDAMPELGKRSNTVLRENVSNVTWEHSHVIVRDDGLVSTFCIYSAPNPEEVLKHADHLGQHEVAFVHEITADVTPDDFPLDD